MGFVCAFRGRRDSYQVPVALAEAGKLDLFVTDYYMGALAKIVAPFLPERLSESVQARHDSRIPRAVLKQLSSVTAAEAMARALKITPAVIYDIFDPAFGRAASKEASRRKSDLLMYSSYAWEAFRAKYVRQPKKILFQYHPHYALEGSLLETDRIMSEKLGIYFDKIHKNGQILVKSNRLREDSAWKLADHVICASNFTKQSLVEAGADPTAISVVPYGVSQVTPGACEHKSCEEDSFHALFVGSGLQRKGLHHLLLSWRKAALPPRSRLTVVSRVIDPCLLKHFENHRSIHLIRGVTQPRLSQLYRESTVFVMPSIVEGFGQVYLEALSHGLPVVGTRNTCLPDLGNERDGIFITAPGAIDELASLLERLSKLLINNAGIRHRAKECADRFTWERFRAQLRERI